MHPTILDIVAVLMIPTMCLLILIGFVRWMGRFLSDTRKRIKRGHNPKRRSEETNL